jgi:opacity protein-like surface antigen
MTSRRGFMAVCCGLAVWFWFLFQLLLRRVMITVLTACLVYASADAADQITASPVSAYALREGTNEFGIWGGGSPDSNVAIGETPDTSMLLFGLRYGRVLKAWDSVSLEYTFDLLPAAVVFQPSSVRNGTGSASIYGAGITPFGLKLNFGQQSWIKPFVAASVGFLYFTEDVPVPDSRRFNFTPELGLGAQFFLTPKTAITVGYKYFHISNANTGHNNPGLDNNVIYAGYSFFTP